MELLYIALAAYSVGIGSILLPKKLELAAHYCATLAAIVGSGVLLQQALVYLLHGSVVALSGSVGFFTYNADRWSAVFLLIIGLAGTLTSIYAWGYAKGYLGKRLRLLGSLWNGFLLTMVLVLIAADVFSFLLAWELMAVVSFLLVNHEAEKKATHNAAYQYLVMTHIGTAAIMIAFLLVGSQTGALDFASMSKAQLSDTMRNAAFLTAFAGFALKSGLLPLHVWLPNAHPAAPSHVSALMSGVMLKIAVYGFGRFVFQFLGTVEFWWGALVLVVGLLSAVLGALYAQMEKDMKRVLGIFFGREYGPYFRGDRLRHGASDDSEARLCADWFFSGGGAFFKSFGNEIAALYVGRFGTARYRQQGYRKNGRFGEADAVDGGLYPHRFDGAGPLCR